MTNKITLTLERVSSPSFITPNSSLTMSEYKRYKERVDFIPASGSQLDYDDWDFYGVNCAAPKLCLDKNLLIEMLIDDKEFRTHKNEDFNRSEDQTLVIHPTPIGFYVGLYDEPYLDYPPEKSFSNMCLLYDKAHMFTVTSQYHCFAFEKTELMRTTLFDNDGTYYTWPYNEDILRNINGTCLVCKESAQRKILQILSHTHPQGVDDVLEHERFGEKNVWLRIDMPLAIVR